MLTPDLIRRLPRFADLSPAAMEWLLNRASIRKAARGETLFMEGDACTHFFILLEGEVKIFKILESGREIILGIFHAGEAIGEVAVMDGTTFPANACIQKESQLLALGRADYLKLLESHPEVARSIIRDLTLRMRALRVRVEILGESGVNARIAQLLLSFSRELGQEHPEGLLVPVKLNRAEIAAMVGARVETVIRTMSAWQKDGVVSSHDAGFLIKKQSVLEKLIAGET